jgi:hypothetical protein
MAHLRHPSLTENVGEIRALQNSLKDPKDIAIRLEKWKWTPEDQWPPVDYILRSKFWTSGDYQYLRQRLNLDGLSGC